MAIVMDNEVEAKNEDSPELVSLEAGQSESTAKENVEIDVPGIDPTNEEKVVDGAEILPEVNEIDDTGIDPTQDLKLANDENIIPTPLPDGQLTEDGQDTLENQDIDHGGSGGINITRDDTDHDFDNVIGKTDINPVKIPDDPSSRIDTDGMNDIVFDPEHFSEQLQAMLDKAESIRAQIDQAIESAQGMLGDAENKVAEAESVLQRIKDAESARSYA